jgi:hypothetical protein
MPTISRSTPSSRMTRPIADPSPPKRSIHREWPMITTWSRPGDSSPGLKLLPLATEAPSTARKLGEALLPKLRRASPWPVTLISEPALTEAISITRDRAWKNGTAARG